MIRGQAAGNDFGAVEIGEAVTRGLAFLEENQMPSGELSSKRSLVANPDKETVDDSSPFLTAVIVQCLAAVNSAEARRITEKAVQFFLAEMEPPGVWRYWTRRHEHHFNIPPDLDDTVCISAILAQNKANFPDNKKLILANRNADGLFYTWLVPRFSKNFDKDYWRVALRQLVNPLRLYYFWKLTEAEPDDVDGVVNANVLYYLGESELTKPVIQYLIDIIQQKKEETCDKWYLNRFTFYYAVARNYAAGIKALEPVRKLIIQRIHHEIKPDGRIGGNILETAIALCALLNLQGDLPSPEKSVNYLLENQQAFGAWQKIDFYFGGPKKYYGWGSKELTTAFCLEALTKFSATLKKD